MCTSKNTIFPNMYYKLNGAYKTFYRKIVHFQFFEYANELICIIIMKDRFYLSWGVELVPISYQKHSELQCKGVTLLSILIYD